MGKQKPIFYDNDTCNMIDNEGNEKFSYWHEDIDQINGADVFNGQKSVLWKNFRAAFWDEIKAKYQQLRSDGKLSPEVEVAGFITNGSGKYSMSLFNEDIHFKYSSLWEEEADASNLGVIRGTGAEAEERFFYKRYDYMDSEFYAAPYAADTIALRIYTPSGQQEIAPNPAITVTPYQTMYTGVRYKANGALQQARTFAGQQETFEPPTQETFNDTETAIYGASLMSDIGDLAPLYCGSVDISRAKRLKKIKIGDAKTGYQNGNLTHLSIGINNLMEEVDVRNCPNFEEALDVSGCRNIKRIYAKGSGITGVTLPEAGYLETLQLPGTIANLTIRNQQKITDFTMDGYQNLTTLWIENCTNIPVEEIINAAQNLSRVRVTDVAWEAEDAAALERLAQCYGLDENGKNTDHAVVTGTCHVKKINGDTMNRLKKVFPDLAITYNIIVYTVKFVDWDGKEFENARQTVVKGENAHNPVTYGDIAEPTRASTDQYDFKFFGWDKPYTNVTSDLTITATYTSILRYYQVRFYVGTEKKEEYTTGWGYDATYAGAEPTNPDAQAGEKWVFTGWLPSPKAITGETNCVAQFEQIIIPEQATAFQDCTWGQIIAVANADLARTWWQPGDQKDVELLDGTTLRFEIGDFDHDLLEDRSGTAKLTVIMLHLEEKTRQMNKTQKTYNGATTWNNGGWSLTDMREYTNGEFFEKLPLVLQKFIEPVIKKSTAGNKSTEIIETVDKCFLLSTIEVNGNTSEPYNLEGKQYPIFTDNTSRIKCLANGEGVATNWWLRSPCPGSDSNFYYVSNGGYWYSHWGAGHAGGVCVGFCIGNPNNPALDAPDGQSDQEAQEVAE